MLEVGDKVICVNSAKQAHTVEELNKDMPNWVKKGEKYTIRAIYDWDFVVGVLLEEVRNNPIYFSLVDKNAEPCFATWRFEKLITNNIEETCKVESFQF